MIYTGVSLSLLYDAKACRWILSVYFVPSCRQAMYRSYQQLFLSITRFCRWLKCCWVVLHQFDCAVEACADHCRLGGLRVLVREKKCQAMRTKCALSSMSRWLWLTLLFPTIDECLCESVSDAFEALHDDRRVMSQYSFLLFLHQTVDDAGEVERVKKRESWETISLLTMRTEPMQVPHVKLHRMLMLCFSHITEDRAFPAQ